MKTFKDSEGREWRVAVTVTAVKRVRDIAGVDLLGVADGKLLEDLINDPVKLVDTVYALCEPQAQERGVSDAQFGEAMAGEAIDAATEALLEGLVGFFPNPKRRALRAAMDKLAAMQNRIADAVVAKIESGALEAMLEEELRTVGASSTGSPAS